MGRPHAEVAMLSDIMARLNINASSTRTGKGMNRALPRYQDVQEAAERLRGVAHRTPVLTSQTLNGRLDAEIFFKCENLQKVGAFKFRRSEERRVGKESRGRR